MWKMALIYGIAAISSLGLLACALYGFLYLPFQEPAKQEPEIVQMLPRGDDVHEPAPLRGEEAAVTSGEYGWSDRAAGRVRIPIDVAMTLLAERLAGGQAATSSESVPRIISDAGSGRFVQRPEHEPQAGSEQAPADSKSHPDR